MFEEFLEGWNEIQPTNGFQENERCCFTDLIIIGDIWRERRVLVSSLATRKDPLPKDECISSELIDWCNPLESKDELNDCCCWGWNMRDQSGDETLEIDAIDQPMISFWPKDSCAPRLTWREERINRVNVTYLFMGKFRKANGLVTCGDSFTYPAAVGGVQHCIRECAAAAADEGGARDEEEGGGGRCDGIARLVACRGARSFCTARR